MPLYVNGKLLKSVPSNFLTLLSTYSDLAKSTDELKAKPPEEVGTTGVLYVGQREFAAVSPDNENISLLGTDDATTCHILLVKHTGSGVVCLGHLDGCRTKKAVSDMVKRTKELSCGGPEGRFEVHLVGGFMDDRGTSQRLTCKIFQALIDLAEEVHLRTLCVSAINDTVRDGLHYPVIYGIAIRIRSGEVFPATFTDKGPDADIRSAGNFTVNDEVREIFRDGILTIGPFDWSPDPELIQFIYAPDVIIRKVLSTSPEQEPPYFVEHIRRCLCILRDHPLPKITLFPGNHPRLYSMNALKQWILS